MKNFSCLSSSLLFAYLCFASASFSQAQEQIHQPASSPSCGGSVTYQINPAHTGAIQLAGLDPPLTVKWSVDLGAALSYPLIACGKVFVLVGPNNFDQVNLYALDAETGATIWWYPLMTPAGGAGAAAA